MGKRLAILVPIMVWLGIALAGCSVLNKAFSGAASIKTPEATIVGLKDQGKPATLDSGSKVEKLQIPEGSTVVVTKTEAVQATATTPYLPAVERFEFKTSKPTEWAKTESVVKASTGTVDTSIAAKRIDSEESRPLLYAALAGMVGVGIFIWLGYPTPAFISGGASVVFFLSWKLSGLPDWFWVCGVAALAAAAAIYLGHERAEKTISKST